MTNHITQNIAAIPLFWVVPLGGVPAQLHPHVRERALVRRPFFLVLFAAVLAAMGYAVDERSQVEHLSTLMPLFVGGLFICCMVCHGELAGIKPAAGRLTQFYLLVALGGAIGGLFVAVVAPAVFPALWEVQILLVLTPAVVLCRLLVEPCRRPRTAPAPGRRSWPEWRGSGPRGSVRGSVSRCSAAIWGADNGQDAPAS